MLHPNTIDSSSPLGSPSPSTSHLTTSPSSNLFSISEFRSAELSGNLREQVKNAELRITKLEREISSILTNLGLIDSTATIGLGPELEFYSIAGEESFGKRINQINKAHSEATKLGSSYEELLAKDDSYMPKSARFEALTNAFKTKLHNADHVIVDREPGYRLGVANENSYTKDGLERIMSRIALFQHEIVSPPRSPQGLPVFLAAIGQRIIDKASEFGLLRAEILTDLHDMSCSSLHLHLSLFGDKNGQAINLMQRDSFPDEKGRKKCASEAPSQLALHIAHASNEFLRDYIFLFATTEQAYDRFSDKHFVGTSFIGFRPCKHRFNMGTAMFRGAGRRSHRPEDTKGEPDTGPLRIEFRMPDVGCIGHPNKRAYPDQFIAPYDITEALLYIVKRGVESYANSILLTQVEGRELNSLTEASLYEKHYPLPATVEDAILAMRQAVKRDAEPFLSSKRIDAILARTSLQEEINALDRKPNLLRGQHINRSKELTLRRVTRGRSNS